MGVENQHPETKLLHKKLKGKTQGFMQPFSQATQFLH